MSPGFSGACCDSANVRYGTCLALHATHLHPWAPWQHRRSCFKRGRLVVSAWAARKVTRTPDARPVWPLAHAQIGFLSQLVVLRPLGHGSASMALIILVYFT